MHSEIKGIFVPYLKENVIDTSTSEGRALVFGALQISEPTLEFRQHPELPWENSRSLTITAKKAVEKYQFRIEPDEEKPFPVIKEGELWHNPLNFSPKQFGTHNGYRPALESELLKPIAGGEWQIYYAGSAFGWYAATREVASRNYPYRTRMALPPAAVPQ